MTKQRDLKQPYVLLIDYLNSDKTGTLYNNPDFIIEASSLSGVEQALSAVKKAQADGYYLAGWFAYELLAHFEPKLKNKIKIPNEPLIWLLATKTKTPWQRNKDTQPYGHIELSHLSLTYKEYQKKFGKIQDYIIAGDVYQINYTYEQKLQIHGEPENVFTKLAAAQPVSYAALIDTGNTIIYSLSPELFFTRDSQSIITKPMKGTAPRGKDDTTDAEFFNILENDQKNKAENLMIVDLLRNDLSRIAMGGTVKVDKLFEIERYQTVHQMTSTISATINKSCDLSAILKSLFPCGSVTGAPKVRAMEIISEVEETPRGVYCGAIGVIEPNGDCCFNVPSRTIITDQSGLGRINVGSGIVADSSCLEEWEECKLKAQFIHKIDPGYDLFEF